MSRQLKRRCLAAWFVWVAALAETVLLPIPAHADANSYLQYIQDHHINTGLSTPASLVNGGLRTCDVLRSGMSPDQLAQGVILPTADVRGLIDAAQRELCPDTIH